MKILLLSFLLLFSGCQTAPTIHVRERCVPVISNVLDANGQIIVDSTDGKPIYKGKCRCISYEWTKDHIGPVKDAVGVDHDLKYCDRMSGMRPDEWGLYVQDLENFRLWLIQQQNH